MHGVCGTFQLQRYPFDISYTARFVLDLVDTILTTLYIGCRQDVLTEPLIVPCVTLDTFPPYSHQVHLEDLNHFEVKGQLDLAPVVHDTTTHRVTVRGNERINCVLGHFCAHITRLNRVERPNEETAKRKYTMYTVMIYVISS